MKKVFYIITLVVLCLTSFQNMQAQTFKGKLTNIQMNNKHFNDVNDVTFTLTSIDGEAYKLRSSPIGPIGKMPGTINVDASVLVDTLKQISPDWTESVAGTLDLKIGGSLEIYMTNISGSKTDNSINFVLDTYSLKILGIEAMKASVTFNGTKVSN